MIIAVLLKLVCASLRYVLDAETSTSNSVKTTVASTSAHQPVGSKHKKRRKFSMRFTTFSAVGLVGSFTLQAQAFSPVAKSPLAKRSATVPLHVAPIGGPEHIPDADTLAAAADQLQHYLASSSTLLSDAAAATADAAQEVAKDTEGGWWNSYLEFMKGGLSLVHSVIDEPLRKAGWEQTWGPSIFLFTASK